MARSRSIPPGSRRIHEQGNVGNHGVVVRVSLNEYKILGFDSRSGLQVGESQQ